MADDLVEIDAGGDEDFTEDDIDIVEDTDVELPEVRNDTIIIVRDEDRRFSDSLSQYEACRLISVRTRHLEINPTSTLSAEEIAGLDDSSAIALAELKLRVIPLLLHRRFIGNDGRIYVEIWNPREMALRVA
ncbi:hypothetical protein ACOMHN_067561 [Nucella lapillus]